MESVARRVRKIKRATAGHGDLREGTARKSDHQLGLSVGTGNRALAIPGRGRPPGGASGMSERPVPAGAFTTADLPGLSFSGSS